MQFNKTLLTAALLTVGGFTAISANAAGTTEASDFDVTMTVESVCSVDATGADIAFGSQDAGTPEATVGVETSGATINVLCSKGAPYIVNLTPNNVSSTTGAGTMTSVGTTDTITYELYSDLGATVPWGNTGTLSALGNGVSGTGAGLTVAATTHSVYAKLTSTTDVKLGSYSDTVSATVTY